MNEPGLTANWDRLSPPPRDVPNEVRTRLWWAEVSGARGLAMAIGMLLLLGGGGVLVTGPAHVLIWSIPIALGLAVLVPAVRACLRRRERAAVLLSEGRPATATILSIWDRNRNGYLSYDKALDEWSRFSRQTGGAFTGPGLIGSFLARQLREWPCRVHLSDGGRPAAETETKLDIGSRLIEGVRDPVVRLLFHPSAPEHGVAVCERNPWLTISPDGRWIVDRENRPSELGHAFLRSFVPVAATYALAAIGLTWGNDNLFARASEQISAWLGAGMVLLFTVTHAIVPVFFYRPFFGVMKAIRNSPGSKGTAFLLGFSAFIHLHMGVWYGVPMVALAAMTGWLNLPWAATHVALARRGTRHWVFLEYGSTSLALLLFLVFFSGERLFPLGMLVVLFQSVLLTVMDWKGRELWIPREQAAGDRSESV